MKKFYLLLFYILFVALIANSCFGEEDSREEVDGRTWTRWDESWKLGWVMGFGDGIFQANRETLFLVMDIAGGIKTTYGIPGEQARKWADEIFDEFEKRIVWSRISFGQFIKGLDEFYIDYRNKTIPAREAIYIIKLQVKGAPEEFVEQEKRLLRIPLFERGDERKALLAKDEEYKISYEKWSKYLPWGLGTWHVPTQ